MAAHETFSFPDVESLRNKIDALGVDIPLSEDPAPLAQPVKVGRQTAPNAIAVLPMEGCDSGADGAPTELVERRYLRFAGGGAGLVWWEACAVVPEGRANPRSMMLTPGNAGRFARLVERTHAHAAARDSGGHRPLQILQLTHSGRYCRPVDRPQPMIAQHDPILDARSGIAPDSPVVSDTYLDELIGHYVRSARLARECGFDGVDIKACHRYLVSELLGAHARTGRYGGSYENRSRFLLEVVRAVRAEVGDGFSVAVRFNVFDAHPWPSGFGCGREDFWEFAPDEPVRLVGDLCGAGADLLSNSAGNPYYIYPQVTRPFDRSSTGIPIPDEHPLESVARLFAFTATVQAAAGEVPVVGNGYSWLRQYLPLAGAANLARGGCRLMGLGRSSIAYPDAPREILSGRGMDPRKCCVTCSKCTQMMRDGARSGCVVRDPERYLPIYREARARMEAQGA